MNLQQHLEIMLAELESNRLEVCLAPSKRREDDYSMIRVCLSKSPRWYSLFCANHASSRGVRRGKFDTRIRRQNIERVLGRIAAGRSTWSKYADELTAIARRRVLKGAA